LAHARLIVNPAAGGGRTGRQWPQIMNLLKNLGLTFEYDLTEAPGHATELAKRAAEKGYKLVISVGGDGTVNEVANGLYAAGNIGDVTLGVIGHGTGSDFSRNIGVSRDYIEACHRLVSPNRLLVDLGIAEYSSGGRRVKRLLLVSAALGLGPEVVKAVQTFKAWSTRASYPMATLVIFLSHRNSEVCLTVNGELSKPRVVTIVVCNGRYTGGGMLVVPHADLADGFLDVLVVGDMSKLELLLALPRVYKGTHISRPKIILKRAAEIDIDPGQPMPLQIDGELVGEAPARFCVLPAALNVVV
jgi:diacylglycerol kinase (ATP)